ncbi:hypothetical protein TIFTF001_003097 [Ficus carica]|uniref:Disease resistance R13L4/SHOC-2-like LRR domain-containing protein n=1 Tax=Ficus carica TaxID=3494 RepID=A0AA87ZDN1_FICCA|nr:hypothetical protein TIFTF001_003097 [Ficus carica]
MASSNPTPSPEVPNTTPTPPTPTPPSGAPSVDPSPVSEVPDTTPTPPSAAPIIDPTPPNASTPPSGAPSVDPALLPEVPNTTPTPLSGAASVDPAPPPDEVPDTTPTPPSKALDSNPTPPPEVPKTTPPPPSTGAPSSSPTPPSGTSDTTPTPLVEASSSDPTPPPPADTTQKAPPPPEVPSTTPTSIPSGATPTPSAAPPSTTPTPEAPSCPTPSPGTPKISQKPPAASTTPTPVGKTWVAREISRDVTRNIHEAGRESEFGATLWLSLNKKYHRRHHQHHDTDRTSTRWFHLLIVEDIARQLCVLPRTEGGFEDEDEDEVEDAKTNSPQDQKGPKTKVPEHHYLDKIVFDKLRSVTETEKKLVLLTLDGVPESTDIEEEIISPIESLQALTEEKLLKVVVTTKRSTNSDSKFAVEPLKQGEFLKLLEKSAEGSDRIAYVKKLFEDVIFRKFGNALPAAVAVVVGKALKHNFVKGGGDHDDQDRYSWQEKFENFLKEAEKCNEAEEMRPMLVRYAFDTLPRNNAAMIRCCWHSRKFFELIDNASVHYNELISHWIMEGYLDDFRYSGGIEKAYEEGYRIFQELMKRGLLKVEDENFIAMEGLTLKVFDHRRKGFDETAMLGLPDVFQGDEEWQGLGKIAVADGMIKSVCKHKKWELVSTLMIDGSRLCREVPASFFKPLTELRVLVLLNPTLKSLDFIGGGGEGASQLSKLQLLVLRGCDVLENADSIKNLESLIVLEISGAKSLKTLPDDLFEKMSQLRSLNLSGTRIKSLPSSFTNLTKLRWLILRDCSNLEGMPSLKQFKDLLVLDMFRASSLTKFGDKKFGDLVKLRVVDFSEAKIAPLPFVHTLHGLTRLTLEGCTEITRLPHLRELPDLRFLELPGATKLKEFYSPRLENKKALRVLNLSKTELFCLPSTISDLISLVELDLSYMPSLKDFGDVSFSKLACLERLNLSNTDFKSLPPLSSLKSLRELFLRDCQLEALPEMEGLTSLEILDLSGAGELKKIPGEWKFPKLCKLLLLKCKKLEKLPILDDLHKLEVLDLSHCEALEELEKQSFEKMSALQVLDLSATKVRSLPTLPSSPKLRRLLLEKCVELGEIPSLDSLSKLEELSLSGAKSKAFHLKIESVSLQTLNLSETSMTLSLDFTKCTNLKKLSLRVCLLNTKPQLEKLTMLEDLDLSCTSNEQHSSKDHNSRKDLSLEELSEDLKSLWKLTRLDLWGLKVKEFPYWTSGLVHLKSLRLPDLAGIPEVDWGKIKRLPDELNWEECGIFKNATTHLTNTRPSISISTTKVLQSLKQHSETWEKYFGRFRIYVCPSAGSGKDEEIYRLRDESFYEDIYFKAICCPESCKRFLEIRGFEKRPEGLEDALEGVDCLSFIEDEFITSLSNLGVEKIEAMTGLWLERCAKTEFIFSEEEAPKLGEGFSILWASNLPLLKSLYEGNVQVQSFKNLTELYLDCCPEIEYVFSLSHLPEKLEKLQVKFCNKLKTLMKRESSADQHELRKLRELHLLELPELSTVGVKLPSLQKAKVKGCPRLKKQEFISDLGLQNKTVEVTSVEENWERGAAKETKEKFKL